MEQLGNDFIATGIGAAMSLLVCVLVGHTSLGEGVRVASTSWVVALALLQGARWLAYSTARRHGR